MGSFDLYRALDLLPGIVLGLTVHEAAHAWAADRLGDPTARDQGRVTLDPWKHLDPWGLIVLFVAGFGWAKPVQFDPSKLRRPQRDAAWVAAAGPLANVATALVLTLLYAAAKHQVPWPSSFDRSLLLMLALAITTNWGLAVFNLLPLPPLDGSHLVFPQWKRTEQSREAWTRWGTGLLFVTVVVQNQTGLTLLPVGPVVDFVFRGTLGLLGVR